MDKLLSLIEENPRLSNKEMAVMLGMSEENVEKQIRLYVNMKRTEPDILR